MAYRHPKASVISSLRNVGIKTYRTDISGSIIAASDGTNITFTPQ